MTQRISALRAGLVLIAAIVSGCSAAASPGPMETAEVQSQPQTQTQTQAPPVSPPAVSEAEELRRNSDPAACAAAGGSIRHVGLSGMAWCVTPNPDAGKVCHDKADCTGRCISTSEKKPTSGAATGPAEGVCQATNVQFGCFAEVVHGQAQPTLCAD